MIELNNDLLGLEPPPPITEWGLRERALAAASFWGAVGAELDMSLIRDIGTEAFYEHTTAVYGSHQRQFFLRGLEKLGIAQKPDAVKCALYHAISNALGGWRTRYSIESPQKAWIFYYPKTMGSGAALYSDERSLSVFRGWHVHNGESLGNEGLVFAVTHLSSRGDPFNAGYFLDVGEFVPSSERLQVRLGEVAPAPDARLVPGVDIKQWPEERRLRALQNFAVAWAWDQIARAVERFGAAGLGSVRHGLETAIFSYLPYYAHAIPGRGVQAAAGYFGAAHEICGWNIATTARNGEATVAFDRDPIRSARGSLPATFIAEAYGAVTSGWARAAAELGAEISLTPGGMPTWLFRAASSRS
jgi:hypothetical protein